MWFQSTHSLRSATGPLGTDDADPTVSIHALLAECDLANHFRQMYPAGFNPRTPCGVRRIGNWPARLSLKFQSTHSLRSATESDTVSAKSTRVSIHALLAECDAPRSTLLSLSFKFQSTHSLRSATDGRSTCYPLKIVSIHALLAECDLGMTRKRATMICFNPRTPCGVRPPFSSIFDY